MGRFLSNLESLLVLLRKLVPGIYLLEDIDKYRFLVNGNITLPNVDDAQEFQSTLKSMRIMGFAEDEITCQ